MARRSNVIVILGLAVFIVGAAATYFLVRDSGGSDSASSVQGGVQVLYASDNIPAGTSGSSALQAGLIKTKNVTPAAKPASALTDAGQLNGRTTTAGVPQGSVLTDDAFPVAQTRVGTVKIPDGKTAFALNMTNVPGVAGYAGAGDKIDIYALTKPDNGPSEGRLVQQNIEILSVNGANLTPSPGQPGAPDRVFLVAVDQVQAEQLAYLSHFEHLYFSLVNKDQAAVSPTPGVNAESAVQPR
ncbi:MAG TPA: RcpC/CpaB family pilus assembly protein [Acidimicrobiales bacterium]|nr:RcpC/CpaB family pilus assembly protein [Acidimicrobiales bacterium]